MEEVSTQLGPIISDNPPRDQTRLPEFEDGIHLIDFRNCPPTVARPRVMSFPSRGVAG